MSAAFACSDQPDGSGVATCAGTMPAGAPIDTGTLGPHTFTVTAVDAAGERSTRTAGYTVVPRMPGSGHPTAAPRISKLTQSHRTWREGTRLARLSRHRDIPVGTTFSFALDQRARAMLAFAKRMHGRKLGNRWTLTFAAHAGTNKVLFQGRVSRSRQLTPATYTLTITAINAAAQRSRPHTLTFTVVR